jgi:hypothetical protein
MPEHNSAKNTHNRGSNRSATDFGAAIMPATSFYLQLLSVR